MDVLVLTTNTLQGYEIDQYYGYVSSKFVTGLSWFRNVASIGSDILGGVVNSYTDELTELEDLALENLKSIAGSLGMNCLLGVKIDIEPVFSQGTSMFMISAIGTAVNVKDLHPNLTVEEKLTMKLRSALSNTSSKSLSEITSYEFETISVVELRKSLMSLKVEDMENLFGAMLSYLNKYPTCSNKMKSKFKAIGESLIKFDRSSYLKYVFPKLNPDKVRLLNLLSITDYSCLQKELEISLDKNEVATVIPALGVTPMNVYPSMKSELSSLIAYLDSRFNEDVEIVTKGMLSKSESWVCKGCNAKVDMEQNRCHVCFKDRYGIASEVLYRHKIAYLRNVLDILSSTQI